MENVNHVYNDYGQRVRVVFRRGGGRSEDFHLEDKEHNQLKTQKDNRESLVAMVYMQDAETYSQERTIGYDVSIIIGKARDGSPNILIQEFGNADLKARDNSHN